MSSKPTADLTALCQQQFLQSLHNAEPLSDSPVQRWVIAHSGGLDSQVLLHLAANTLPASQLQVLHINHQLQQDADSWAEFSRSQASRLNIPCQVIRVSPESGSENAARQSRYAAFAEYLQSGDCLLLAQHADDQVETVLFRLLRGTGLHGLAGMPASRPVGPVFLYRPLLGLSRAQLEQYARQHQLEFVEDPSNRDTRYSRNFLRNQILPLLRSHWPELSRQLLQLARHGRQQTELLNTYLDRDLAQLAASDYSLDLLLLQQQPVLQQEALLRRWLEQTADVGLNSRQLQQLLHDLLRSADDAQPLFQFAGIELRRYRQRLYLLSPEPEKCIETLETITSGELDLGDGVLQVVASASGLKQLEGVQLKRRQGGERCRPVGRGCSMSVKNLLHDAGIPPWLRSRWPLLYAGDEVAAVPGICVCESWYSPTAGFSLDWVSFSLSERR